MQVNQKQAELIDAALAEWQAKARITEEQASGMRADLEVRTDDRMAIALYAFIAAMSCAVLAFGALVLDEQWIEQLRKRFHISLTAIGLLFTLVAALFIYFARRRQRHRQLSTAAQESYNLLIVFSIGIAVTYVSKGLAASITSYALPLLIAAAAYGAAAIYLRSRMLWVVMICTLLGFWGVQLGQLAANWHWLGLNFAWWFSIFTAIIFAFSPLLRIREPLQYFYEVHYMVSLTLFLLATWVLSIFGNYDDMDRWVAIRQLSLWYFSLGYSILLVAMLAYSLWRKRIVLRNVVLAFIIINLYTRYFEYFWDITNKGIFFAILAISFWLVGRNAEKIKTNLEK